MRRPILPAVILLLTAFVTIGERADAKSPTAIPGFEMKTDVTAAGDFVEQVLSYELEIGVKIHINAPRPEEFDLAASTTLILYALPNGNSTEWTIGKIPAEGEDWHFDIQNIGAQTRYLRRRLPATNIVVAYLEADKKSWPSWRRARPENARLIHEIVEDVVAKAMPEGAPAPEIFLTGHSGGGSLGFGFLNGCETIPDSVTRIAFLDSNYGFEAAEGHGDKLAEWLSRSDKHRLIVLAYDDRDVEFNGKKIVSPTGGTYRATHRMVDYFNESAPDSGIVRSQTKHFSDVSGDKIQREYQHYRAYDGRLDFVIFENPELAILHTVLVGDWNGYIYAATQGAAEESTQPCIAGGRVYQSYMPGP